MMLVNVDDKYSFSLTEEDFLRLGLYENAQIKDEEIKHIKDDINFRTAKSKAIRFVSLRLRSEKEVGFKLDNDGFDKDVVEKVLEELKSMGYINDMIYAQKYVFDRSKLKPKSKRMIKFELLNKGISEGMINESLDGWEVDEVTVAEGLIKKRFGKYDLNEEKVLDKVRSFLHHRGYSFEVIEKAIRNFNIDE